MKNEKKKSSKGKTILILLLVFLAFGVMIFWSNSRILIPLIPKMKRPRKSLDFRGFRHFYSSALISLGILPTMSMQSPKLKKRYSFSTASR